MKIDSIGKKKLSCWFKKSFKKNYGKISHCDHFSPKNLQLTKLTQSKKSSSQLPHMHKYLENLTE